MIYLADVNVWVALALVGHVHHFTARAWFEEPETGQILFTRITQMGLLRLPARDLKKAVLYQPAAASREVRSGVRDKTGEAPESYENGPRRKIID